MAAFRTFGLAVLTAVAFAALPAAEAQQVPRAAAGKEEAVTAARIYEAGIKAFEAGKMGPAISALSTALTSGGLTAPQLAKVLYYRGMAYRRQGQPAHAIADLVSAIWLRGGLSDLDRRGAVEQRLVAYREAGLSDTVVPQGGSMLVSAPASPAPVTAALPQFASQEAKTSTTPAVQTSGPDLGAASANLASATQGLSATPVALATDPRPESLPWAPRAVDGAAAPASSPPSGAPAADLPVVIASAADPAVASGEAAASETVSSVADVSGSAANVTTSLPPIPDSPPAAPPAEPAALPLTVSPVSAPQAPAPAPPVPDATTVLSTAGHSAAKFFSGLFPGSATMAAQDTSSPIETASTQPPPVIAAPVAEPAATMTETWNSETSADATVSSPTPVAIATAAPAPAASPPPHANQETPAVVATSAGPAPPLAVSTAPATTGGTYRLQIAATSSRAEAEQVARDLQQNHGLSLREAVPEIYGPASGTASIFGSMGPSYRVSLGPYLTAVEPGRLCNILRPHGYDCQVVSQEAAPNGS